MIPVRTSNPQIKLKTQEIVYDVGPISNHCRRPLRRHILFLKNDYYRLFKRTTEPHSRSVLVMHSNSDQHISSQNMLQIEVYITIHCVTNCKQSKSTQADRKRHLADLKQYKLRAVN